MRIAPIGPGNPAAIARPVAGAAAGDRAKLGVHYGPVVALDSVDLELTAGEVTVLMGRNGSGKSTLLNTLAGGRAPTRGSVQRRRPRPHRLGARPARSARWAWFRKTRGFCSTGSPYATSVAAPTASRDSGRRHARRRSLDRILPGPPADRHPRDLSEGQRLALALAVVLAPAPPICCCSTSRREGSTIPARTGLIALLRRTGR